MLIFILRTKTLRTYDPAKNLEFEKHEEDLCHLYYYLLLFIFTHPYLAKSVHIFMTYKLSPFSMSENLDASLSMIGSDKL